MATSPFQDQWRRIAKKWDLRIETPFVIAVRGTKITLPVLLRDFGAARGMLLVTDYGLISRHTDDVVKLGYGYSCLSEPSGDTPPDDDDALMEMLADWGWAGEGSAPAWYRGATS